MLYLHGNDIDIVVGREIYDRLKVVVVANNVLRDLTGGALCLAWVQNFEVYIHVAILFQSSLHIRTA